MNAKVLKLIFILITSYMFSQNNRFVYEYTFKLDSLHRNVDEKEFMYLDILKDKSNFYSKNMFDYDSLVSKRIDNGVAISGSNIIIPRNNTNPILRFRLEKRYPSYEIVLHTQISGQAYSITENSKINWKIIPETKIIEGMKVQKAITSFIGREWTAWFTEDYPFNDGPYKFHGLPGLIIELHDSKDDHHFRFIGNKKLNYTPQSINISRTQELNISPKKFKKAWYNYLADPVGKMRNLLNDGEAKITIKDVATGRDKPISEFIREKEQAAKNIKEKTNNYLDLELYRN
ncbi:GLPGLI family protein [Riemerella anatipestifer]|uniref:GLPGLI family protein n=1 Tax=Riemerella anatipestifer TaxID=34085 RepID=UPI0012AE4CFE|nr:GLPGLI family protein [Riemerella anatipestifer]USL95204.1 GLPGLI family protein [Riemerella anatipestifer]